jgi:membrane-associated phospholipid phosphatase
MPSLHAMDALIVGVVLFSVGPRAVARAVWLAWPAWVSFTLLATGNHFWLDVAAAAVIAIVVALVLRPTVLREPFPRPPSPLRALTRRI